MFDIHLALNIAGDSSFKKIVYHRTYHQCETIIYKHFHGSWSRALTAFLLLQMIIKQALYKKRNFFSYNWKHLELFKAHITSEQWKPHFLLCLSSYHGMAKKEKKKMRFVGASGGVWSVDGKLIFWHFKLSTIRL